MELRIGSSGNKEVEDEPTKGNLAGGCCFDFNRVSVTLLPYPNGGCLQHRETELVRGLLHVLELKGTNKRIVTTVTKQHMAAAANTA